MAWYRGMQQPRRHLSVCLERPVAAWLLHVQPLCALCAPAEPPTRPVPRCGA
jgi:hypothetical protein